MALDLLKVGCAQVRLKTIQNPMRIEIPRECERIGSLQIYGLQKVYELDGGEGMHGQDSVIERIPSEVLYDRMREMVIVVFF